MSDYDYDNAYIPLHISSYGVGCVRSSYRMILFLQHMHALKPLRVATDGCRQVYEIDGTLMFSCVYHCLSSRIQCDDVMMYLSLYLSANSTRKYTIK